MLNTNLYIITHKEIKNIFPKDRKIMLVNASGRDVPNGYCSDYDTNKKNISEKNPYFCELTGLYFMTQNDKCDILGLEHYRRVFVKHKLFVFKFPFLKKKQIERMLVKNDIILPEKGELDCSVYDHYCRDHIKDDIDKVGIIIQKKYPDYVNSFNKVMNDNKLYFCNMFIGKFEIIKEYSNWMFDILFELEKDLDLSYRDTYQKRVYGFLSERLFNVWLDYHKEIKIKEMPVQFIETSPFKTQLKRIAKRLQWRKNKNEKV